MSARQPSSTKTEGAIKAGNGRYAFDLARLSVAAPGREHAPTRGPVVEGERIQIGLVRMPKGTGCQPHRQPNEQWIYVLQGTLESEVGGVKSRGRAGSLIYIPADTVHSALATPDEDVILLTAKDMSHGIAGTPVEASISVLLYTPGSEPTT